MVWGCFVRSLEGNIEFRVSRVTRIYPLRRLAHPDRSHAGAQHGSGPIPATIGNRRTSIPRRVPRNSRCMMSPSNPQALAVGDYRTDDALLFKCKSPVDLLRRQDGRLFDQALRSASTELHARPAYRLIVGERRMLNTQLRHMVKSLPGNTWSAS